MPVHFPQSAHTRVFLSAFRQSEKPIMKRIEHALLCLKDPGSAATHGIAMILSLVAAILLLIRVSANPSPEKYAAFGIFSLSVFLLYCASTTYHSVKGSPHLTQILKKIDHMMIFFMIAGSYTPVCAIVLGNRTGWIMLAAVWGVALLGMGMNLLWINCPKWVSSVVYIAMGWICVFAFLKIKSALSEAEFALLLSGGIIYTIGGVIYALKLPLFRRLPKYFGNHEIFHCFVIAGSVCHYSMMFLLA